MLTEGMTPAATMPMISTTTSISMSVKPAGGRKVRMRVGDRAPVVLLLLIVVPISNVGVDALTARLTISAEREQVVLAAVRAGIDILVVVSPRIPGHALDVAPGSPVMDGRIGRLLRERF